MNTPSVPDSMKRVMVVGTTGSGKSTLAEALAQLWNIPHIDLDSYRFLANWATRPPEDSRVLVDAATQPEAWVCCGNYGSMRDITWSRADTIVYLDYPMPLILWRLTRRSITRAITRENLWNSGSRENFFQHLQWNERSLYYWAFKTHNRRKTEIPATLTKPEYTHLRMVHLTGPRITDRWLADVRRKYAA